MRLSTWQSLNVEYDAQHTLWVTLNQPEKRNALSALMIDELTRLAKELSVCSETKAVVLRGEGSIFCAGGDLAWMQEQIHADRPTRIKEATKLANMLLAWNTLPQPLIAQVHGGAYGGGAGLCCICDVAIATNDTRFGFTETKLGLIPATIGPYVIARLGEGAARQVFMSARLFNAEEAVALGLIAKAVPEGELSEAVAAELAPYQHTVPEAVAAAKSLARSLGPVIDSQVINSTIERLADTWETESAKEAIERFFSREK